MLQIKTSGVCPKCGRVNLPYFDGKFGCCDCSRKYTSKEIVKTMSDLFEITTSITKQEFYDKIDVLKDLTNRFAAVFLGYDDCNRGGGLLYIGWEDGYPVRLNMMVQELNEILD